MSILTRMARESATLTSRAARTMGMDFTLDSTPRLRRARSEHRLVARKMVAQQLRQTRYSRAASK